MRKGIYLSLAAVVLFGLSYGFAGAYGVSSTDPNIGPNIPQLPIQNLNSNWANFFQSLPIQNFITSLETAGGTSINQELTAPQAINGITPQSIFQVIDNWTTVNLGFRFSSLFAFTLQLIEWVLAIAKAIIDWLLTFVH
jgi:hypothetical protein